MQVEGDRVRQKFLEKILRKFWAALKDFNIKISQNLTHKLKKHNTYKDTNHKMGGARKDKRDKNKKIYEKLSCCNVPAKL